MCSKERQPTFPLASPTPRKTDGSIFAAGIFVRSFHFMGRKQDVLRIHYEMIEFNGLQIRFEGDGFSIGRAKVART